MEKIKVLHITQSAGEVETYLRLMIEHIDRSKFEIVIASPAPSIEQFCAEKTIKYYHLSMARGFNPFMDVKSIFNIRGIIKKEKPALVHLHSTKAGFLGRVAANGAKCKSLFAPHGMSYLSFTGFKRMLYFMLELIGKKYTDKVLFTAHSEASRTVHEIGISEKDIYVIPNSLNITEIPKEVPGKAGELQGKIRLGTIGQLTPQKNPLLFVDIAYDIISKYPGAHFYFLGAGAHDHLREEVDKKIKKYGIENNFHLINKDDQTITMDFLNQLDIFLLPSVFEGVPRSLLEAMLAGLPCIVSKCDGNNDVISHTDNGFSCLTREDYVHIIEDLVCNADKAKQIGARGRQHIIEKYNIQKTIKQLEDIYTAMS